MTEQVFTRYKNKKFTKVLKNLDRVEHAQERRNAYKMPVFFFLENTVEEATEKLLNGFSKKDYKIPSKEQREEIRNREMKKALLEYETERVSEHNSLINTITEDCKHWEQLNNADKMLDSYMYLNECKNSKESGLYQLILNGKELWYGTLAEINAVIKTMIMRIERDF